MLPFFGGKKPKLTLFTAHYFMASFLYCFPYIIHSPNFAIAKVVALKLFAQLLVSIINKNICTIYHTFSIIFAKLGIEECLYKRDSKLEEH